MILLTWLRNLLFGSPLNRRRVPTIMQQEAAECGVACLAMIMARFGRWVGLEPLRETCGVSRDGSKAASLLKAARLHGMEAKGFNVDIRGLRRLPFPCIVFWKFNHFVVVEGMGRSRVWLNDPATGPRVAGMEEFDKAFTGVALAFEPTKEFRRGGSRPGLLSVIFGNLRGGRKGLIFALLAGTGLLVPGILVAGANRIFVDDILVKGEQDWLIPLLTGLGTCALLTGVLTWLQKFALVRTETALSATIAVRYFWTLLSLPMSFFSQRYAGDIANRMSQAERMAGLISSGLAPALIGMISILGYGLALFFMDYVVASVIVLVSLLALVTMTLSARSLEDASRRSVNDEAKLYGLTMQGLSMREDFRASGTEGMFLGRWFAAQGEVLGAEQETTFRGSLLNETAGFLISIVSVAVLVVGGLRVMDGALTIGMLLGMQALASHFTSPVLNLVGVGAQLQSIRGISERLSDTLNADTCEGSTSCSHDAVLVADQSFEQREEVDEEREADPDYDTTPLVLRNVSYSYSPMTPTVVSDFSIRVGLGARVALVGPSGSGKSTLGHLMVGLKDPVQGDVMVFGTRLNEWQRSKLSREVTYVDQNVCLFEGSIRDNITLWDDSMPEENYVQAAQDAMVHGIITSRPGGYAGRLLEGGRNLSGGERQRLALARAFAVNPRLMILDEATSALDPLVEKSVMDAVRRRGASCVLIAHRISTIMDCDMICVLDRGRIVEFGTHQELVKKNGLYRQLVEN